MTTKDDLKEIYLNQIITEYGSVENHISSLIELSSQLSGEQKDHVNGIRMYNESLFTLDSISLEDDFRELEVFAKHRLMVIESIETKCKAVDLQIWIFNKAFDYISSTKTGFLKIA